jgi:hypothetical protein
MDVSGLERVAKVKAWVRGTTNDDWAGTVTLRGVTLARDAAPSPAANLDVDASLGDDLTLRLSNRDVRPLTGELELSACDGIETPDTVQLQRIEPGATRTFRVPVRSVAPADPRWPRICMSYHGIPIERVADVADPTGERALPASIGVFESFEDGTAGWTAGENVTGISAVGSMANGPGLPRLGRAALDAASAAVPADAWRTVAGTLDTPLDLSDAGSAFAFFDGYGGAPGATGYEARLTLRSADGTTRSTTARIGADTWSRVTVPVAGWADRDEITGVEAAFRAVGSGTPWAPHFQVDFMGTLR